MSLLPIAVVVVAFFFLFTLLGEKTRKPEQPQVPPQTPPPTETPQASQDKHSPEPAPQPTSVDGLASFRFVEGNSYPRPITPPRRHPCRVCGVPSTKRCLRCKSVYYCSREHSTQASLRRVHQNSMHLTPRRQNLKGLADTQTPLFAQLGSQSLSIKNATKSSPRC
jgi:hypothetical protein